MPYSRSAHLLRTIWYRLTEPHSAIQGIEERQRAKTLSTALAVSIPLLFAYLIFAIALDKINGPDDEVEFQTRIVLLASVLNLIPYLLSRTRYTNVAALAALSITSILLIYRALSSSVIDPDAFYYLALPLIFCGLLLPRRMTLGFLAVNVFLIAVFMATTPVLQSIDFIRGPITFLLFLAFIVIVTAIHRGQLEQVRQSELSQLVTERTASLLKANDALQAQIERRSQIEASLKDEAAFYRALFDKTNDAVFIMDLNGVHLRANKRAAEMLGYTVDEITGMHYSELVAPEEHPQSNGVHNRLLNGDTIPVYERVFRHKDGTLLPVELNVALVRDGEGQPRYLQSAARDITQRRKVEEWLQKALEDEKQLTNMRSRFFSMVSHEFRTPLTVILSSNQLLTRYRDRLDDQRRDQHHERIESQVQHLVALLDDVMLINKADATRFDLAPESLNLREFCSQIIEELRPILNANLNLEFCIEGDHEEAVLDPRLLRRILTNLLSNAIKYSPEGGNVEFGLDMQNGRVKFRVVDQGIGIPLEDQAHLFEVFHRAGNVGKISGTGLGLVIVKQAVEMHGGQMHFESTPGQGTAFTVELPREITSEVGGQTSLRLA